MRGALFDLDGTLVDSLPGIALALNESLVRHGFDPHPESAVRTFVGDGIRTTCRRALPEGVADQDVDRVENAQGEIYDVIWREYTRPFEGILELLDTLLADGVKVGVCSNKTHPFTVEMVAALFPRIPAAHVIGHQAPRALKPDPASALEVANAMKLSPDEVAFVGDSTVDFETGHNAGMPPVLVTWGYHDHDALARTGAPLVDSVTTLRQWFQERGPA